MDKPDTLEELEEGKKRRDAVDAPRDLGPLLVRLLSADDPIEASARFELAPLRHVSIGRGPAPEGGPAGGQRIPLRDPYASTRHAHLDADARTWRIRDEGSRNGTWVDGRRLAPSEVAPLHDGALVEVGHTFFLFRAAARGASAHRKEGTTEPPTLCPEWELVLTKAERVAATRHEVLIEGESGAGKEVLARFLHDRSGRRGPLVSVNCAALPEHLLEDELFGHVRGAFSGALANRTGLVRAAHEGTLFLDEIGDMPPALQARLLRVLEDHRVRPLGGETEVDVDVRVISATHRDLAELVAKGAFRHDLLARLGLLPLRVPPVRERREDLGILIRAILGASPRGASKTRFELEALRLVLLYPWPLNVRELRSAILAAADLAGGDVAVIAPHHLPAAVREAPRDATAAASAPPDAARAPARRLTAAETELRDRIVLLLTENGGNVAAAARAMGKKRTNLQRLMARLGIDRKTVHPSRAG